ncbi:unnamed protein product [Staurois parvus]|uniref:Uncharacterized protein n=1 Tax=Staurois parvus TaxID=386267 RepID=A0ABN9GMI3_9NEOB|nr:unnamed protein product [Staurois parvus]
MYIHYIAKSIGTPLQIIGFWCSNHFHGHRCITCRLLLQTFVNKWVALRSSVTSKHGTVIGCHLCNKSIHDISWPLNIPRSIVSGIVTKWKQLETTTQLQSGRPCKMTERGQRMLKRTEVANSLQSQ